MRIKKTISTAVSCCQLKDFRLRSHKRSKSNSKCGSTFSPSGAWRCHFDSSKMCSCPINLFLIFGIICVRAHAKNTLKTAWMNRSWEYFLM